MFVVVDSFITFGCR